MFYDASRKLILKGVDGVVFVADSQIERTEANLESIENLKTNLRLNRLDPDKVIFYTFTLWKDPSGQPMQPPGALPGAPRPGPAPPGEVPPLGDLPPLGKPPGPPPARP